MNLATAIYSLALRAYPRDFRDESGEEILATLNEVRAAGEDRGPLRQALSLSYNGNRLRWLRATGGSMSQTARQGVVWGVLILVAWQAGLGIYELAKPLWLPWPGPSLLPHYPQTGLSVVEIALLVGWLAVFGLLALGRRSWGLALLGVVLAGFVARQIAFSLSYGGHFSWEFTLNFFLPVLLPLLCALAWPARPARLSLPFAATIVAAAVFIRAAEAAFYSFGFSSGLDMAWHGLAWWAIQFGLCLVVGALVLLVSLSDPRWAAAVAVVAFQPVVRELVTEVSRGREPFGYAGVVLLVTLIPLGALLLSFRAHRRVAAGRG